ncbi:MAG: hypothetical protein HYW97_00210 [Candidatus Wildermuthbacteria bacterium]|nr:hypothetical protein [Candidatus Wildermuthbacteria bacterium]
MGKNRKLVSLLNEIAEFLDIQGVAFKPAAYRRAAQSLEALGTSISRMYKKEGLKGIRKIKGIGQGIALKVEEYIKTKKIKYHKELREKTVIRQVVTHFFETKGVSLEQLKRSARKKNIVYGRFAKSARELLDLTGSVQKAKDAITKVGEWARTRDLDYSLETVLKKWLELDTLKPKPVKKKAFYRNKPMVWSEIKKKWFVITPDGEWLEFADKESMIEWRIVK